MSLMDNPIIRTDAYKLTHWLQYPPHVKTVYSYLESRGGLFKSTVFFGLQYYLKEYLGKIKITESHVIEAKEFSKNVFGNSEYFNEAGFMKIVKDHQGMLPIKIRAVPEGSVIPTRNVLMTIENTDDALPWVTNWAETLIHKVWYPITVATLSWQISQLIDCYASQTGEQVSLVHLNDFGYRGVSSEESAGIGGAAHLVNFIGTDTLRGIALAKEYYNAQEPVGVSVFASEHSTTTIWGRDNEIEAIKYFMNQAGPNKIISIVADSYNYWSFVSQIICGELREAVIARGAQGGKTVIRPDSGHPPNVIAQTLEILEQNFPIERNPRGFKLLPKYIGIIYGDWISYSMIDKICRTMLELGWAVSDRNVVFGMGGKLLQGITRDTQKFAFKCSAAMDENGNWFDVFKDPFTDKSKQSKRGILKLIKVTSPNKMGFMTVSNSHPGTDELIDVFENGNIINNDTFEEIRDRSRKFMFRADRDLIGYLEPPEY